MGGTCEQGDVKRGIADATPEDITKLKTWLESRGGNMSMEDFTAGKVVSSEEVEPTRSPINIPLTDEQKLTITNLRLRRATVQRQIAELQTQDAKLEGVFHGELTKIAIANKIDMENFVLNDNLDIHPKGQNPQQLRA